MNEHLVQLASASERAASLHTQSGEDMLLASEYQEEASLYGSEAAEFQEGAKTLRAGAKEDRIAAAAAAESGAQLEEEATAMEERAKQDEALAASDAEASEALHLRAGAAHAAAIKDDAAADADDAKAVEKTALAEEEHASAVAAAEEAEAQEAIFDTEEAAGALAAEAAAEAEEAEEAGAAIIATCEFFPFLDVVCTAVGGVAGVALQVAAAAETAESITDFAAAATAKAAEEAALAEAEELNAKAIADEEDAAFFTEREAEMRARAEIEEEEAEKNEADATVKLAMSEEEQGRAEIEELEAEELEAEAKESEKDAAEKEAQATEKEAEAEEEEAAAEEKSSHAEKEEAQAEEEEGKAEAEEEEGDEQWEESIKHGLGAFWNASLSAIVSLSAALFFGVRLFYRSIGPAIASLQSAGRSLISPAVSGAIPNASQNIAALVPVQSISYGTLHVCSLAASIFPFTGQLTNFAAYTPKARGGLIVLIACVAAFVQSFILHLVPHASTKAREHLDQKEYYNQAASGRRRKSVPSVVLHIIFSSGKIFLQKFVYLAPLITIELLILWINFGRNNKIDPNPSETWQVIISSLLWAIFLAGAGFHIWYYELKFMKKKPDENDAKHNREKELNNGSVEEDYILCQKDIADERNNASELDLLLSEKKRSYRGGKRMILNDDELDHEQSKDYDAVWAVTSLKKETTVHPLTQYFYDLQLAFEILVISCMIALIGSCFPNVYKLHHTFKVIGKLSLPRIAVPIIWCASGITTLCMIILCLARCKP
mmetsp:Transcript_3406/g.5241  ORF Transcript_3406/g.5241 Transcript_3406/m.5241 type:complete len:775 (-) Transcript_3406:301-2625(-)